MKQPMMKDEINFENVIELIEKKNSYTIKPIGNYNVRVIIFSIEGKM